MHPTLENSDFYVCLDTETTGFAPSADIIQFGAVLVYRGKIRAECNTLIKPTRPVPKVVEELTGITNERLVNAPSMADVVGTIRLFINDDLPVVSHYGLRFDVPRLNAVFAAHGLAEIQHESVIDTCGISRAVNRNTDIGYDTNLALLSASGLRNKDRGLSNLASLCARYRIDISDGLHDAYRDAVATAQVWERLRRTLRYRRKYHRGVPKPKYRSRSELAEKVSACTKCRLSQWSTHHVMGYGSQSANIMFVGEASSRIDDREGEPLSPASAPGDLLREAINSAGLDVGTVYFTNAAKCWPPMITQPEPDGTRPPTPDEVAACYPYLRDEVDCVQPSVIVAFGRTACDVLTEGSMQPSDGINIGYHTGKRHKVKVLCTHHPSYILSHDKPPEMVANLVAVLSAAKAEGSIR